MKISLNYKSVGEFVTKYCKYLHSFICKGCDRNIKGLKAAKTVYVSGYCCKCFGRKRFSKKVSFRHYKSNKVLNYDSITDFCKRRPNLGKNAKYHFWEVLNGKRLHYKGWLAGYNKCVIDVKKVQKVQQLLIKQAVVNE